MYQEQVQTETLMVVQSPVYHAANEVKNTHRQLATQMQQMQVMMQSM